MGNPKIPKGYQGHYAKNSSGDLTLIMVTNEQTNSKKGVNTMAKDTKKPAPANSGGNNNGFTPTFRKYSDMSKGEQEAFRQGATTANNGIKERLGLKKPKGN